MATPTTNLDIDNYYEFKQVPVGEQNEDETKVATVCSDDYRFNPEYLNKNLRRQSDFKFVEHYDVHGNAMEQKYDYLPDQVVEQLEIRRSTERVMLNQLQELKMIDKKVAEIKGKGGAGKGMVRGDKKAKMMARMRKKLDDKRVKEAMEKQKAHITI